jgi:hypothetical protein
MSILQGWKTLHIVLAFIRAFVADEDVVAMTLNGFGKYYN